MNTQETISFSILADYQSLEDALMDILGITRSSIKKISENKKNLKKKVYAKTNYEIDINIVNRYLINPNYDYKYMDILYEDENFIAINKVHGVHSHPLRYLEADNCLSFLRHRNIGSGININDQSFDRGLLYRLDKVTSGVLILVKKIDLYNYLRNNYKDIMKTKSYLAIVEGRLGVDQKYKHYFKSVEKKGQKIIVSDKELKGSKRGVCTVRPIKFNKDANVTLVLVQLKTGLRHQIRSQLSHIGYPIVGDELYGGRKSKRVFLHAYNYIIKDEFNNLELDLKSSSAPLFESFFDLNTCL